MKQLLLIIYLLAMLSFSAYSQQAGVDTQRYNFTITDCINYAYEHQVDVKNAGLDVKSADYHVKEIIGQGLPQLSGSATFQDYVKSPTVLFPDFITPSIYGVLVKEGVKDGNGKPIIIPQAGGLQPVNFTQKYNSNIGVTLNQIIFDPNYIIGLQGRKTYKELYSRSYTRTKIEANVNVTKAYYQVLVSVEQLKLLEANITELKQQLDETVARNKQGFVEKIDVDRITVQFNSLVTKRENTLRLLGLNYQLLKFQMGMPVDRELILKDKLEDIRLDGSTIDATNDTSVYKNRIEYNLLETQTKLNGYDLKSKKGQFLPKLTANASYAAAFQANTLGDLYKTNFPSGYFGFSLSVPIFAGNQRVNQVRQSEITVLKSQNQLIDMKNTVNLQVSQARIAYINGLQTLNDQKKNMALADDVLRVSKIKYQQVVGSSIEVTQAQTAVQDADNTYIQGLYDALVSKVDLDKAYGRIK